MGIGYGRAAGLIDFMAEDGIVGQYNGSQAREILISLEQWSEMSGSGGVVPAIPADRGGPTRSCSPARRAPASEARVTTAVVSAEEGDKDLADDDDAYDDEADDKAGDEPDDEDEQDEELDDPDEYDEAEHVPAGDGGPAPYSSRSPSRRFLESR